MIRNVVTICLFLLLVTQAIALELSPARQIFDTPGEHEFRITIRPDQPGIIHLSAQGDLASHIKFHQEQISVQGETVITGKIAIPEDLVPGDHEQRILVSLTHQDNAVMSAHVEVISLVVARKEYAGPYLVASVATSTDQGQQDTATVYITIENRGNTAVTPTITLLRPKRAETVPSHELLGKQAATFTKTLQGHGEEQITLQVKGANHVEQQFIAILGHPKITHLSAEAIPEQGAIHPIVVKATIDWTSPVPGTIQVGKTATPVLINTTFEQTVYAETADKQVQLTLTVGNQEQTIIVPLEAPVVEAAFPWITVIIIGMLLCTTILTLCIIIYRRTQAK